MAVTDQDAAATPPAKRQRLDGDEKTQAQALTQVQAQPQGQTTTNPPTTKINDLTKLINATTNVLKDTHQIQSEMTLLMHRITIDIRNASPAPMKEVDENFLRTRLAHLQESRTQIGLAFQALDKAKSHAHNELINMGYMMKETERMAANYN